MISAGIVTHTAEDRYGNSAKLIKKTARETMPFFFKPAMDFGGGGNDLDKINRRWELPSAGGR
jgi:hypothetical protein